MPSEPLRLASPAGPAGRAVVVATPNGLAVLPVEDARQGVALVLATVAECRPLVDADYPRSFFYAPARWAWILSDLKPLRPFPVRGVPGFCKISRDRVEQALREAA